MATGKREMVLAAMEIAFERSTAAEELGLAILVQYVDMRLPEIFDGRKLRTTPIWEALLKDGINEQDLQVPFLALKSWEALFAALVELPVPLAQVDNETRAKSTATLGIGGGEVAKLISERADQLAASPEKIERQRMSELLRGVSPAAAKPAPAVEIKGAGILGSIRALHAPGDRRIPLWALGVMIAILVGSGLFAYSYVREPPLTDMDPTELQGILPVRNAQQKGAYFIATLDDPKWATQTPFDQYKRAKALLDKLVDSGVVDMTLLDMTGDLAIHLNTQETYHVPEPARPLRTAPSPSTSPSPSPSPSPNPSPSPSPSPSEASPPGQPSVP